jgi:Protein of unknown function (DUF2934)
MDAVEEAELEAHINALAYKFWEVAGGSDDPDLAEACGGMAAELVTRPDKYAVFEKRIRECEDKLRQDGKHPPDGDEGFRRTAEKTVMLEYLERWRARPGQIKALAYKFWEADDSPQDPGLSGEFWAVAEELITDEKEYAAFQARIEEHADLLRQDADRPPVSDEKFRDAVEKEVMHEHLARWRRIRDRAYFIWEEEGRPPGHSNDHWAKARKIEESSE